jgi:hypothetical protein
MNAHLMKHIFRDNFIKKLLIPRIINNYNHYIGGVDIANQLYTSYKTHRLTRRTWWPLFL